jgi:hypothetical protein
MGSPDRRYLPDHASISSAWAIVFYIELKTYSVDQKSPGRSKLLDLSAGDEDVQERES